MEGGTEESWACLLFNGLDFSQQEPEPIVTNKNTTETFYWTLQPAGLCLNLSHCLRMSVKSSQQSGGKYRAGQTARQQLWRLRGGLCLACRSVPVSFGTAFYTLQSQ